MLLIFPYNLIATRRSLTLASRRVRDNPELLQTTPQQTHCQDLLHVIKHFFFLLTVCYSTGTGFQCRCEEQFAWPYSTCVTYGACDQTWSGICKCINAIPAGNQSCQPISGNQNTMPLLDTITMNSRTCQSWHVLDNNPALPLQTRWSNIFVFLVSVFPAWSWHCLDSLTSLPCLVL